MGKSQRLFIFLFLALGLTACRQEVSPPTPGNPDQFSACVILGTKSSFDVITFNLEGFPRSGYSSVVAVASLIKAMDPDVVAIQEVASRAGFDRLVELLPGWTGIFNPTDNADWNLAYLFKEAEADVNRNSARLLFPDDRWAFPREPFEVTVKHQPSGKSFCLINLHLKCCGGNDNENSRRSASRKLKSYLDVQKAGDAVIMLGDFNDEISSSDSLSNPFLNFILDKASYSFADQEIANGSALWWSYPSYPSHIDHILVTNEVAPWVDSAFVVKASPCYPAYSVDISDHRPVGVRILPK